MDREQAIKAEVESQESEEISDRNLKMWHDIYAEEKKEEWEVINNEEIQTQ